MKISIIFFFLISFLHANDLQLKSSILYQIFTSLIHKEKPIIYIHSQCKAVTKYPEKFTITDNCADADLVILSTLQALPNSCQKKILFGTKYSHLNNKRVIGAFFWQKGRPNILFYKNRLQMQDIILDSTLTKYIENE